MEGCGIRRGREQPRPRFPSGCWWHAVLTASGAALEPRVGSSHTGALVLAVPPAASSGSVSLLSRLGDRVSSTDTAFRWWEQTFLRSGCCLASYPCSRWGACQRFLPRGSGHTCVPVWPGRALRLPNALPLGQGLGTQVRSLHPLAPPESMFLGFVFEHFSELAISLFHFPLVRTTVTSCGHGGALGSCLRSCWTFYAQPPT